MIGLITRPASSASFSQPDNGKSSNRADSKEPKQWAVR
jgi:hypothetical protein